MQLQEIITKINQSVEDLDLVTTRKYIEENIDFLNENKNLLKSNARALLDFLTTSLNSGLKPLGRQEMNDINTINTYASRFDLSGLKLTVKNKTDLLLRNDVIPYLSSDARILLEGMCAIEKKI